MRAELKVLHCPAIDDLETYRPNGDFGIFVQALIGPKGGRGEESFGITICTPHWFEENMKSEIEPGHHVLFMRRFDHPLLWRYLSEYCESCEGKDWASVACRLSRLGAWEFEDYRP